MLLKEFSTSCSLSSCLDFLPPLTFASLTSLALFYLVHTTCMFPNSSFHLLSILLSFHYSCIIYRSLSSLLIGILVPWTFYLVLVKLLTLFYTLLFCFLRFILPSVSSFIPFLRLSSFLDYPVVQYSNPSSLPFLPVSSVSPAGFRYLSRFVRDYIISSGTEGDFPSHTDYPTERYSFSPLLPFFPASHVSPADFR